MASNPSRVDQPALREQARSALAVHHSNALGKPPPQIQLNFTDLFLTTTLPSVRKKRNVSRENAERSPKILHVKT